MAVAELKAPSRLLTLNRRQLATGFLVVLILLVGLASLAIGATQVPLERVIATLLGTGEARDDLVVLTLRLPRIVAALFVGAGMGIAGAAMQGLYRNPLADPGLIGVSSGAALGAIATIVLGAKYMQYFGVWAVPFGAILGALAATFLTQAIGAVRRGEGRTASLLLGGIAINALVGVVIGILTFIADDRQLRDLTFWTMGNVGRADWSGIGIVIGALSIGSFVIIRQARALDAIALGESGARHLGVDISGMRNRIILATALMVGTATAFCGMIGFVGIVVPHLVRMTLGPGHRHLLPLSALGGALLLLTADLAGRNIAAPLELPVGLMTGAIGAPFFLWLLTRRQPS
ncbi:FecCD family ABC transporter permease [Lacibacterium aquatile]|uniref:FecCD family ABC transporter permease n=1 Tax=Lacibacterium aquatile TaxID=1168082 RepID=A0ABW5DKE3_9PROT